MASFQKTFRKSGSRKFNSFLIPSAHYSHEKIAFLYLIVSCTDSSQSAKLHEFADRLPFAINIFFCIALVRPIKLLAYNNVIQDRRFMTFDVLG